MHVQNELVGNVKLVYRCDIIKFDKARVTLQTNNAVYTPLVRWVGSAGPTAVGPTLRWKSPMRVLLKNCFMEFSS